MNAVRYESPVGILTLVGTDTHLVALQFPGRFATPPQGKPGALAPAIAQLDEYFAGERQTFELDLNLKGTEFQQRVWAALRQIPFGETTSYGVIARELSEETGQTFDPRGVGGAVGSTPVPIIVPCHRVSVPTAHSPATAAGFRASGRCSTSRAPAATPPRSTRTGESS